MRQKINVTKDLASKEGEQISFAPIVWKVEEKEIYEVLKRITKQLEKCEREANEDADSNKGFDDEMASFYRGKETALVYARNLIEVTFEKAMKGE